MKLLNTQIKTVDSCLEHINQKTGIGIIISRCLACGDVYAVKLGTVEPIEGRSKHISSGMCVPCGAKKSGFPAKIKEARGSSPIWFLVGLAGSGLFFVEYFYAIIKYME